MGYAPVEKPWRLVMTNSYHSDTHCSVPILDIDPGLRSFLERDDALAVSIAVTGVKGLITYTKVADNEG